MSDKFEEAVKEYLQNPIFEWTTQEMIEGELLRFANWYHDKYLAEALTAAAMMKLHEEQTPQPGSIDLRNMEPEPASFKRDDETPDDKGTCETFREQALREANEAIIAQDLAAMSLLVLQRQYEDALELARTIEIQFDKSGHPIACGRRIVEVGNE
jgi:hypothetical protein